MDIGCRERGRGGVSFWKKTTTKHGKYRCFMHLRGLRPTQNLKVLERKSCFGDIEVHT